MEKKLLAAKVEICDLQDSKAHILENLENFKADYRIWNPLFGNQFLEHLRLRQTLALGTTQGAT
jgi:hypothetical protein